MPGRVEIAIVGAGAVGSSIAFHLALEGQRPLLIDRGFPGGGTSRATAAWVWVQTKRPDHYAQLTAASIDLYPVLVRRLGMDIEYNRTGGLSAAFTDTELDALRQLAEDQRGAGIQMSLLTPAEALRLEPALSPEIAGALYCPLDGNVNPLRLVPALVRAGVERGVQLWAHTEVLGIRRSGGGYVLSTSRGPVRATTLVLAAGPWSSQAGSLLGLSVPVRLERGQILVTEPLPRLLRLTIQGVRQQDNGEVLFGYSHEDAGLDPRTTIEVIREIARDGARLVPALARAHIVRTFAGIRVIPADGLPILGPIPGMERAYIAATHSGITLSPIVGEIMAALILTGTSPVPLEPYLPDRFLWTTPPA